MSPLERLLDDARGAVAPSEGRALHTGGGPQHAVGALSPPEAEVARQMQICNACRYCEGFCAVFPAMTRRLEFGKADAHYLANLCHACGACFHACQYATPHEFAVDVPRAMAEVRRETYVEYAWPKALGALYRRNGLVLAVATAIALAAFFLAASSRGSSAAAGDFYAVFPHGVMAGVFGALFVYALAALALGVRRFWIETSAGPPTVAAAGETTRHVLALTYLGGGHGDGCNEGSDRFTLARRHFHHATFYGFLLCFASTTAATFDHYVLRLEAPYPLASAPVVLGTVGGVALVVGTLGLLWLNLRRDPRVVDAAQKPMDRGFIALLFLAAATGLGLLAWRDTTAMPALLCLHLGVIAAFFATMPYGKFAHGVFRGAALLKAAIEKRRPNPPGSGGE